MCLIGPRIWREPGRWESGGTYAGQHRQSAKVLPIDVYLPDRHVLAQRLEVAEHVKRDFGTPVRPQSGRL